MEYILYCDILLIWDCLLKLLCHYITHKSCKRFTSIYRSVCHSEKTFIGQSPDGQKRHKCTLCVEFIWQDITNLLFPLSLFIHHFCNKQERKGCLNSNKWVHRDTFILVSLLDSFRKCGKDFVFWASPFRQIAPTPLPPKTFTLSSEECVKHLHKLLKRWCQR